MTYDVRAIRFIKSSSKAPILYNRHARYICLGHFDMMEFDSLGESCTPLINIQDDRTSGGESKFKYTENHIYSLYILRGTDPTQSSALNQFWTTENTFTVVTRIHCDYSDSTDKVPFLQIIEQHCLDKKKHTGLVCLNPEKNSHNGVIHMMGAYSGKSEETVPVQCVLYNSLELGDTVAILKSQSLAAILEIIRHISNHPCVRDTYTYCGIYADILRDDKSTCKYLPHEEALLPTVNTRFSIRDNAKASDFFGKFLSGLVDDHCQFYVTGTADHSIQWSNCKESKLIEIMKRFTAESRNIPVCFNDVITRVGLEYSIPVTKSKTCPRKPGLNKRVTSYRKIMKYLKREIKKVDAPSWKYALCKLLGTLETMLGNYVMDDLAYLIIPGVDAFLDRLCYIMDQLDDYEKYPDFTRDICDFLNHWTALMNDISQLESQLTQHPELIPVRYYIPAMILQFVLRFLERGSIALSDAGERSFHPMLIPSIITSNMYTTCPLDPRNGVYKGKCPLLVFIPIHDLYRPWEIIHRATHEIAHYSVDSARFRSERHEALTHALAVRIVDEWYRIYVRDFIEDTDGAYQQNSNNYIDELAKAIQGMTTAYLGTNCNLHLSQSRYVLIKIAHSIMGDSSFLERYLLNVYSEYFFRNRTNYPRTFTKINAGTHYLTRSSDIINYIDLLNHLCSECYADIAMILLLECSFSDYYMCIYHDEFEQLNHEGYLGIDEHPLHTNILRHIQRIALVADVMCKISGKISVKWSVNDFSNRKIKKYPWVKMAKELYNSMCAPKPLPSEKPI